MPESTNFFQGALPCDIVTYVNSYYLDSADKASANTETHISREGKLLPNVDKPFLEYVWRWLIQNPEISIGEQREHTLLTLAEAESSHQIFQAPNPKTTPTTGLEAERDTATAHRRVKSDKSADTGSAPVRIKNHTTPAIIDAARPGTKLYVTERRMWYAVAGHGPNPSRIKRLDFIALSIIAARGAKGILQHDLVRVSGQDKRSLPHRTDRLHDDGYIEKRRVTIVMYDDGDARKLNTSLCTLKRFINNKEHEREVTRLAEIAHSKKTVRKGKRWNGQDTIRDAPDSQPAQEVSQVTEPPPNDVSPQWTAERSWSNQILEIVDRSGTGGMTIPEIRDTLFGELYKKPTENHLARLVDAWQVSQPLHLRHLAVLRDTLLRGKSPVYIHYSYGNFKKLVDNGEASWAAVTTVLSTARKGQDIVAALDAQPDLDEHGFHQLHASEFHGPQNDATLVECASIIKMVSKTMYALDHPAEISDGPSAPKPSTGRHESGPFFRSHPTRAAQPRLFSEAPGEPKDEDIESVEIAAPSKSSTIVRKGGGRPRKYPRTGVPSNLAAMSFNQLKRLQISRRMAEKYQKKKILTEIDRRVDLGESRIDVTQEVLKETDSLNLVNHQDPTNPSVRAQVLHEYAGGPIPEPSELDLALTRLTGSTVSVPTKKGKEKKSISRILRASYWPPVAAHTPSVHSNSSAITPDGNPHNSMPNAVGLESRTRRQSLSPPEDSSPKRSKRPKKQGSCKQSVFQYLPSIYAHSGSFLPSLMPHEQGTRWTSGKDKYVSLAPVEALLPATYASNRWKNEDAVETSSANMSNATSIHPSMPQDEPKLVSMMVKRYQEQLKCVKRPRNGCFAGKTMILRPRLGEPKDVPTVNYKILIFKLDRLKSSDWVSVGRGLQPPKIISKGDTQTSMVEVSSNQTGPTIAQALQPDSRIERSRGLPSSEPTPFRPAAGIEQATLSEAKLALLSESEATVANPDPHDRLRSTSDQPGSEPNPRTFHTSKKRKRNGSVASKDNQPSREDSSGPFGKHEQPLPALGALNKPIRHSSSSEARSAFETAPIPYSRPSQVALHSDSAGPKSIPATPTSSTRKTADTIEVTTIGQDATETPDRNESMPIELDSTQSDHQLKDMNSHESLVENLGANEAVMTQAASANVAKAAWNDFEEAAQNMQSGRMMIGDMTSQLDEAALQAGQRSYLSGLAGTVQSEIQNMDQQLASQRQKSDSTVPRPPARSQTENKANNGKIVVGRINRTGGSTAILRKDIIMDLVRKCGGASPGYKELTIPFGVEWTKKGQTGLPETATVRTAINALCAAGKLRQITFAYQTKQGFNKTASMLTLPEISMSDQRVKKVQDEMIKLGDTRRLHLPKDWLVEDRDLEDRIYSSSSNATSGPKETEAHQRLRNHKEKFQKSEKAEQQQLAALKAIQERNKQRTLRAAEGLVSMPSATTVQKPVQRLASIRKPAATALSRSARGVDISAPVLASERLLPRPSVIHPDLQHDPKNHWLESSRLPHFEWELRQSVRRSPQEADLSLPPKGITYPISVASDTMSRSSSSGSDSAPPSRIQSPTPIVQAWRPTLHNGESTVILPVTPDFLVPMQTFHKTTGTFGTNFTDFKQTLAPAPSTFEKGAGFPSTPLSDMQPPLPGPLRFKMGSGLTAQPLTERSRQTKTQFEVDIDRSEKWELSNSGPEHIRYPKGTFINHTFPHPHETVPSGTISMDEGILCSFTGAKCRLLNKPLRLLLKARHPNVPNLDARGAKIIPRKCFRMEVEAQPNVPAIPGSKRRRSTLVTHNGDDEENEASVQGSSAARPMKRNRIKVPRESRTLNEEDERRLITATIVIRCLSGGLDKRIDWSLVAKVFEPGEDEEFVRLKWDHAQHKYKAGIDKIEHDFQELFAKAYKGGVVPVIDDENFEMYPWKWLVQWVLENIDSPFHSVPDLPSDRSYLQNNYTLRGIFEDNLGQFYELDQSAVTHVRGAVMNRLAWTHRVHVKLAPNSDGEDSDLTVARTWIRANIVAADATYNPDLAHASLRSFSDDTIDGALQGLLNDRVLTMAKQPRPIPGRNYHLHDHMLGRLQKNILPTDFHRAAAYKALLDQELALNGRANYSPHAENGDVMAVLNLVAARRVTLVTKDVPMNKMGHTNGDYQTRQMDKTRLFCSVEIRPLPSYIPGNPLIPLPPPPAYHLSPADRNIKQKIPLWYDIHGHFVPSMWETVLAAILTVLAARPGINKDEVEKAMRPALEAWECEWVLDWLVNARACKIFGEAALKHYATDQWWWLILGSGERTMSNGDGLGFSAIVKGQGNGRAM